MPLTEQQLDQYQAQMMKEGEEKARHQLGNLNATNSVYDNESMTNSVNKFNYNKQREYLEALKNKEMLKQSWQKVANERAFTNAQTENMAHGAIRDNRALSLQWKQQKDQKEMEDKLMKHREREQDHIEKNAAANMNMRAREMMFGMGAQNKAMARAEWMDKANLSLRSMGLQLDKELLKQKILASQGNLPKKDEEILSWLGDVTRGVDTHQNQGHQEEMGRQGRQQMIGDGREAQFLNRKNFNDLDYQQRQALINAVHGIIGAF
jgi:hypothetical protein